MQVKEIRKYLMTILGCLFISLAINCFYVQQNFLSGGLSGLAMIFYYLFKLPIGIMNFAFNIPLFFLAYRFLGWDFLKKTVFGAVVLSLAIDSTNFFNTTTYVTNPLLSAIAGGALAGFGHSLLYKEGCSSGGGDIIAYLVNKFYGISVGACNMLINFGVMFFAAFLFGIEPVLYSCIAFFASFKATTTFVTGFDFKREFIIISEKPEEMATAIINSIGRGVTYLHGTGAYTGKQRKIIFVVVKLRQVAEIKSIIAAIDPGAFVIISDTMDVMGKGFTLEPSIKVNGIK